MRACRPKRRYEMATKALDRLCAAVCTDFCTDQIDVLGMRCGGFASCEDCKRARNGAADGLVCSIERRLMPEGMEWPRFEDGELVRIGDAVESKSGVAFEVEYVEFCSDHVNLYARSKGLFSVEHGERVRRPEPEDTQERIDEDAGKTPCEYFGRKGELCSDGDGCPSLEMDCSCDMAKTRDLLRRQRELDAKGADRC